MTGAQGLSAAEVSDRVRRGLTNAYEEKTSRSVAQILRANLFTVFNAILGVALVLVLVFGHWADALFGIVLLLNTSTGTVAEIRAKRALDRLAVLETPHTTVVRDGEQQEVPVAQVVLDDVVRLRSGEQVPADGTVLSCEGLEIDESILTGESAAVRPATGDRVMSGTTVTAGTGLFRATAVGADAYAHRLAREARRYSVAVSELQAGTNRVLGWISWVIVPVALLLAWSQLRGEEGGLAHALSSGSWSAAVVPAVAGVVGMVPQGLVLLTSVNFATAALALARRSVLVQELPAVEVLARVDTLCLDKTGTITTGRIRLEQVCDLHDLGAPRSEVHEPAAEVLAVLARLSGGEDPNASATAISEGLSRPELLGPRGLEVARAARPQAQVPFSSRRKWSALREEGTTWVLGAPEILLDAAQVDSPGPLVEQVRQQVRQAATTGARVLALASSPHLWGDQPGVPGQEPALPAGLCPRALVVLSEEVRPDAAQTLEYFRDQGVEVKVISGDSPATVAAVARRAGVRGPGGEELVAVDARDLPEVTGAGQDPGAQDGQDSAEDLGHLAQLVEPVTVLGRVTPEQKRSLVRALRSRGHVVAMTGDGVNDALALKEADLGIAMGNGAPATRAVARLVLLSGEFSALPGVVAQGRRVMANTERIASLFLAKTVYASLIAVVVSALAISYPFAPRQLTIVSSLTIGVPAFVLALAPSHQRYRPGFLGRVLTLAVPAGLVAGTVTLLTWTWLTLTGAPEAQVTTGVTLVLVASGLWLLTLTARPLLGWRLGLVLLMGVAAVLGVVLPAVRAFFLLSWPQPGVWWVTAAMAALAVGGIEAVYLVRQRVARAV
ncbi:HAD family hydrolase [Actinomyces sp. 2119]|uniref:HAD family hydrolase n=1 Tax=Actinomyces lilanjuaniae TaxID=2321394 RepID=A0ABM6Z6T9_9ACTO|nr:MULTISPECIES: HAD-IC family P-type ATPase [Actinomyces]AYD90866.1 HAD family hydrolase [Actinomyces lilanjuaniae]RJF44968.1 HAD family hydrolase [Actinomyces sp. 2119]